MSDESLEKIYDHVFKEQVETHLKELIKAISDGIFYLICRKMRLNYFELKRKYGL